MPNITADIKRILNKAFQNDYHNNGYWKKHELVDYLYDNADISVSERTITNYIKRLKDDGAPIIYEKDLGYKYSYKWSLTDNPLSEEDIKNLRTVITILSQYKGFKAFADAEVLINKLQKKLTKAEDTSILLDTNDNTKGIEYIDEIAEAINQKHTLEIWYKQFDNDQELKIILSPYKLVEYNNRWYVFGKINNKKNNKLHIYALDRIVKLRYSTEKFLIEKKDKVRTYFRDIIGVTNIEENEVENIVFKVYGSRAKYVSTKPVHKSLKKEGDYDNYTKFSLKVKINPELITYLLSFGDDLELVSPKELRNTIKEKLSNALKRYD